MDEVVEEETKAGDEEVGGGENGWRSKGMGREEKEKG